jgi:hypothetical protein
MLSRSYHGFIGCEGACVADLWTAEQAADPASRQAGGVRLDVPHAPTWMQAFAEKPLVETGLVQKGFFDAWVGLI